MARESTLELCMSTSALGNTISVHVLEYMNMAKSPPFGFKEVTVELLELGRVLLAIRAGLLAASQQRPQRLTDATEINERLRQANVTLNMLDQVVNKLLAQEGKRGLSKLSKGFRMLFADTDLGKIKTSMVVSREALKLTTAKHNWRLTKDGFESASGIGYAALAAVLRSDNEIQHEIAAAETQRNRRVSTAPTSSSAPGLTTPSNPSPMEDELPVLPKLSSSYGLPLIDGAPGNYHDTSPRSPDRASKFAPTASTKDSVLDDAHFSSAAITEDTSRTSYSDSIPKQAVRMSADPTTVARRVPNNDSVPVSAASTIALRNAVSQKNYRMVEQLLDRGVAPDSDPEMSLLTLAVENHDLTTLRYLLLYGGDCDAKDKRGKTPLYAATEVAYLEAAQLLIEYGADSSLGGSQYDSPLTRALTTGNQHFVQLFLKYCADADALLSNGDTPLTTCITRHCDVGMLELLLLYGANVNNKNRRGESALFKAITANRPDLVSLLLDNGADPNLPAPKHMLWPSVHNVEILKLVLEKGANLKRAPGVLELATSINSFDAVTLLLKHGADPNAKKDGIFTPLCTAIRDDREALVDLLIAAGADPNLPASEYPAFKCITHHRAHLLPRVLLAGANPSVPKGIIETAVAHNDRDALAILLKHKVDPNGRGASGETALTRAIKNNNVAFIDTLLAHHADPGVRGQEWPIAMAVKQPVILAKLLPHIPTAKIIKGALEQAVVADQLESVKLLLAKGISVEEKNGGVFSPLTTSIREDRKEIFRYLIDEAGADPNAPGEHLPIIKAIRRHRDNDLSYIEHLLEKGADINMMYRGWNAVLQAVDNGDVRVLRLLADRGHPDLTARDENGRSVLEIIEERGLKEEERILLHGRTPSPDVADATARLSAIVHKA